MGSDSHPGHAPPQFRSADIQVGHEEIFEALSQLEPKKSLDSDGLSMNFLKKCFYHILLPFKHIINLSFSQGIVPSQLKIAKVIPVFKSGDPRLMNNFRPISLLSNFSKIIEKIMYLRLMNHLNANNIISESQFGFRPGHSTVHPMIHLSNFVTRSFNEKKHVIAIFCDLQKAFDTVDHEILLKKLKKIGVSGTELKWFQNFLTERKQFVQIDDASSSLLKIIIGVPQGSILGPLLFLIYINDLPDCTLLKSLLFADDTTLLAAGENLEELFTRVNSELYKVTCFFRQNRLSIHPLKTRYILFSTNKTLINNITFDLFINDNNPGLEPDANLVNKISIVSGDSNDTAIKFLGLHIDPNFSFKTHVLNICKKVSSALYFMRTAKNFLNSRALTSLYYSLIHCHIIYAIQIWSICSQDLINKLFTLQKKAIRIIHNLFFNAHTESFFL